MTGKQVVSIGANVISVAENEPYGCADGQARGPTPHRIVMPQHCTIVSELRITYYQTLTGDEGGNGVLHGLQPHNDCFRCV